MNTDLTNDLTASFLFFGFLTTVYWMFVGWRAMRAHEELARATAKLATERKSQAGAGEERSR